jgi:Zn-finger protein
MHATNICEHFICFSTHPDKSISNGGSKIWRCKNCLQRARSGYSVRRRR